MYRRETFSFLPQEYLDPAERDVDPDSFFAMFAFADWLRILQFSKGFCRFPLVSPILLLI